MAGSVVPEEVTRCRCTGLTFEQIRRHADRAGARRIKRIKRELNMGAYCSVCRPYLAEMFRTGRTKFEIERDE